jgi:DNA-binding NarL/FixJ family response regulator
LTEPITLRGLVVDDDPSWQQILRELLLDAGLEEVETASSLGGAVAIIRKSSHRISVVDLSLNASDHHNLEGLQVLDSIREYDPGCISILLTGYATVQIAVSSLTEHGANTCLQKEAFQRSAFKKIIRNILASAVPGATPTKDSDSTHVQSTSNEEAAFADRSIGSAIVIDDDAGWRSLIGELLSEVGYQIRTCSSFGEALGVLGRERFQLAVVDLSLTGSSPTVHLSDRLRLFDEGFKELDGARLLNNTRSAGIPTIVVSGLNDPSQVESIYRDYDIFAYLEKQTFNRRAFLQTVAETNKIRTTLSNELSSLTDRERQVLSLLARGMTNKEIADVMVISTNTVKRHMKAVFEKLGVHTRANAVAIAVNAGLAGKN